ncbi:hypothetical protein DESC_290178 [Desulfosarcina cetonica]|nr:hypothetical protein DESC_290178 [Desulfosarcina cetonica]
MNLTKETWQLLNDDGFFSDSFVESVEAMRKLLSYDEIARIFALTASLAKKGVDVVAELERAAA